MSGLFFSHTSGGIECFMARDVRQAVETRGNFGEGRAGVTVPTDWSVGIQYM